MKKTIVVYGSSTGTCEGIANEIASKLGTIGAVMFFAVMYTLVLPPTDNPMIDDHIIMILAMLVVYFFGGFEKISFFQKWKDLFLVKRFPILE